MGKQEVTKQLVWTETKMEEIKNELQTLFKEMETKRTAITEHKSNLKFLEDKLEKDQFRVDNLIERRIYLDMQLSDLKIHQSIHVGIHALSDILPEDLYQNLTKVLREKGIMEEEPSNGN